MGFTFGQIILRDVVASRPAPSEAGRLFFATDQGKLYRDNAATWDDITPDSFVGDISVAGDMHSATVHVDTDVGIGGDYHANGGLFLLGDAHCVNVYASGTITSDRRVKQDITPIADALAILARLTPVSYRFKSDFRLDDGKLHTGFIADELAETLPGAVSGEPDAVTASGEIRPQAINPGDLLGVLARAIQQLAAKVAVLEASR